MKIITTRELRNQTKAVFEMAEKERVAIKRGNKYWELTGSSDPTIRPIDGTWVSEFLAIPEEFRVNPFDVSPSGDVYWADRRNIEAVKKAREGKTVVLTEEEQANLFRVD